MHPSLPWRQKKPSAEGCTMLLPDCTEWNQFSEEERKGSKGKWREKGQMGDTDMVIPDTRVFPTVADTAGHFLLSLLPFQIET